MRFLHKKYTRSGLGSVVERTWHRIATIGIDENSSEWDKKRVRLLNGICVMAILAAVVFCLNYLDAAHRLEFWEEVFRGW